MRTGFRTRRSTIPRALLGLGALTALLIGPLGASPASAGTLNDVSWATGAAIPNPHVEGAIATIGGRIWSISGGTVDCTDGSTAPPSPLVDIYNPTTGTWSAGPALHHARDEYPVAGVVQGAVYVIGGTASCLGPSVSTVEEFSPAGGWIDLPSTADLPAAIYGAEHCGVVVSHNIYYFANTGTGVFDTTTHTWSVLAPDPLLTPSNFCQATRVGPNTIGKARVIITGPGDGGPDPTSQRVLVFRPKTGTIKQLAMATVPLAEHTSARLKGWVVVVGGDFNPTSVQAIRGGVLKTFTNLPEPRDDAMGVVVKNRYYILGGTKGGVLTPDVLIGTPI